ncbi:MAG: hypothetical protein JWN94_4795 [Betaproteobacteria bacterium]|nr:hypothetical protein [Betaproteobacteria bacterium]
MRGYGSLLIVLLSCANATFAADLGRMFFTPAQRATLDNARKQNIRSEISNDGEQQSAAAPVAQNVSVNGFIRRSDGKNTIWLNSRAVTEQQPGSINAAIGKTDDRVHLNVPDSGRKLDLKVGQTVEVVSGTIEENYLRRPLPKPEGKIAAEGEKAGTDVPKVTQAKPAEALKSRRSSQQRAGRSTDGDIRDEPRADELTNKQ